MTAAQESIVRVEGCIQQILPVELLKISASSSEHGALRIAGMRRMKTLEAFDRARIVESAKSARSLPRPTGRGSKDWVLDFAIPASGQTGVCGSELN